MAKKKWKELEEKVNIGDIVLVEVKIVYRQYSEIIPPHSLVGYVRKKSGTEIELVQCDPHQENKLINWYLDEYLSNSIILDKDRTSLINYEILKRDKK